MNCCPFCYGDLRARNDNNNDICYWCKNTIPTDVSNYQLEMLFSRVVFSYFPKLQPTYDVTFDIVKQIKYFFDYRFNSFYVSSEIVKRIDARKARCWRKWRQRVRRNQVARELKPYLIDDLCSYIATWIDD